MNIKDEKMIFEISNFYSEFNSNKYINIKEKNDIKNKYNYLYKTCLKNVKKYKDTFSFIIDYINLDKMVLTSNNLYIENIISKNKNVFKVNNNKLDSEQKKVVVSEEKNLLVVAGAGSGKSLTIVGKIKYLIECKDISPNEILCISFTNEACDSLKTKIKKEINNNVEVLTFHKLGLKILKDLNINYMICKSDTLLYIIHEYLNYIILDDELRKSLVKKYLNIVFKTSNSIAYEKLINSKELKYLENLINKFINLFKSNCYKDKMFELFLIKTRKIINKKERIKNYCFLLIVIEIYKIYKEELNSSGQIDFNDMIIKATKELNQNLYNYKYIIVDEFQDTSLARMLLIKKLLKQSEANLLVVGDDWQSIYRFTGCNLDVFLNFDKYFSNSLALKLQNTYRNSNELLCVASTFIMKNHMQIEKKLKSNKSNKKPIKVIYIDNYKKTFEKLIYNLNSPILILGRNNYDINKYLSNDFILENDRIIYKKDKFKIIRYLTVHKSKGLEAENVIIINLEDGILGFPNKIKNEKVLNFVINNNEKFLYSEERRLFYVALTRTKNNVYLLIPKNNISIFVKELIKEQKYYIEFINKM